MSIRNSTVLRVGVGIVIMVSLLMVFFIKVEKQIVRIIGNGIIMRMVLDSTQTVLMVYLVHLPSFNPTQFGQPIS